MNSACSDSATTLGLRNGNRQPPHDLRRTAATRMAESGVPRDHIAKVLNHVEGGPAATRVYDRYDYDSEKRQALERWDRSLAAIIAGKIRRVLPVAG